MTCAIALSVGATATAKADLDFYVEDRQELCVPPHSRGSGPIGTLHIVLVLNHNIR